MKLAVSGHRTSALVNWDIIESRLVGYLTKNKADIEEVYVGMALGFDLMVARVCLDLGIKVIGCVPFMGHHNRWPDAALQEYKTIVKKIVAQGGKLHLVSAEIPHDRYSAVKRLMLRNEYMINKADRLLVCYDNRGSGGTFAAINYAKGKGKPVGNLNGGLK